MKSLLVAVFSFVTLLSIASAGEGPQSVLQQLRLRQQSRGGRSVADALSRRDGRL
jgi:hypothetical protein